MEISHDHASADSSLKRFFVRLCVALAPLVACAAGKTAAPHGLNVHFSTPREGYVMVNIYRADGTLVRRLEPGKTMPKGAHDLTWDGLAEDGKMAEPGDYTWKGLFHEGIGLKLRGWVGSGVPWQTPDGKGGWGGDGGVPIAVAADDKQVYLGWSAAVENASVLACDLNGRVQWKSNRNEGPYSGCKALAVDDGIVYVLGGDDHGEGGDIRYARGDSIYRLNAQNGELIPWPNGEADLKIRSLWPKDRKTNPDEADAMAVRHGHIYLSFTGAQFLTVLDAKTGAYLQTVVGAPPGMIDIAPTQTELPDAPGKLSDADFGVIAMRVSPDYRMRVDSQDDPGNSVLGRILFAHDPFWVITSDMAGLKTDAPVTALTVVGERAKFHPRTAFVGFGAPVNQVEARPLLDAENATWVAGRRGGRALLGPWQADGLHSIRGVALAADGKLWVAEADPYPKRFSVWDTAGKQGRLVHEFFGSPQWAAPDGAINPLDPDIMVAQNCEWRIDRKTGAATCLGVIARDQIFSHAHYGIGHNGHAYLMTDYLSKGGIPIRIFERLGDGDYKLRGKIYYALADGKEASVEDYYSDRLRQTVFWTDKNGDGKEQPDELTVVPGLLSLDGPSYVHNLDLQYRNESGEVWALPVVGWTSCGAPQYDPEKPRKLPLHAHAVSADGKLCLVPVSDSRYGDLLGCFEVQNGRKLWEIPATGADVSGYETKDGAVRSEEFAGGSAYLPGPLKNVWAVGEWGGRWRVVTEDGFLLGHLFARYDLGARWPAVAKPGVDLSAADSRVSGVGSVTQGKDGKVYIEAGRDAYWNLELTGLEKVKALPGGKLIVSTTK